MTVIAIDGPAASGKGTIARAVAAHYGFACLDTGILYRAVGALTLDRGQITEAEAVKVARSLREAVLERSDLRSAAAGQAASIVATFPEVRTALLDFQRSFARRAGGAVLDGRDIGTVICPDADVKLFITASDEVRAARRHKELVETNPALTVGEVLNDLRERDRRDQSRATAPLRPAEDALVIDTSDLSIEEATNRAIAEIERKLSRALS